MKPLRCLALCCALAGLACQVAFSDALAEDFDHPPVSAKPRTFWFWMNGNVTKDGITRDLEAMAKVGVGGVLTYDGGGDYVPAGPAKYMGPEWRALMTHAIKEANRLGIDFGMENASGWSSTGDPWIAPQFSMQQLVWTETTIQGGRPTSVDLAQPQTNRGYYRDAMVVAFPSLPGEETRYEDEISGLTHADGRAEPFAGLSDGNLSTTVAFHAHDPLTLAFRHGVTLYGVDVWPGVGGRFPALQIEISEDGRTYSPLVTVTAPGKHGILGPAVRDFPGQQAKYVRLTMAGDGEIAELHLARSPRIHDWAAKANFDYRVTGQLAMPKEVVTGIAPSAVVDLSAHVHDGHLDWNPPTGSWTVLRVGYTTTGQENVSASTAGRGLECDKLSPVGVEFHFHRVIEQLRDDATAAGAKGPATIEIDSYEAGMQNWTPNFPAEFKKRTGYDLLPYLPALIGYPVGNTGISERFLFDFRHTQAEMMAEYYYGRMQELCRENGMRLYVEGYGPADFDELQVAALPDVPMTEFWTRTPWTPNRVVKMVTSAAHVYGKQVVAAESFTGEMETSRWLDYPYALKVLGDEMYAEGMNQIVFHRYAQQPHPDAVPGMAMGPYGFNFERTNTWFAQAGPWLSYIRRSQAVLQQGTYVADVLYFTGVRSPDPSDYAMPVVPYGFNYDLVNADVLLHRITIKQGEYVLPEGGRYRLLVLPPNSKAMTPELMERLKMFVSQGAAILGPKPTFSPTLAGYPASEEAMKATADSVWSSSHAGKVFATGSIGETLAKLGAVPDLTAAGEELDPAISWEHRRLPEGDLYFVANRQRYARTLLVSFRGMAGRQPELWHPETGERSVSPLFSRQGDRALVPLQLDPAESVFVVFRDRGAPAAAVVTRDGHTESSADVAPSQIPPSMATNTFTMAMWVKPDTDLRVMPSESASGRIDEVGKDYAIPADPGDARFGEGHATAGLAVGRNGIFVVERSWKSCPAVLVSDIKVSGWTHVAVVFREGVPSLYVNGRFVKTGLASSWTIHPGVNSPPPPAEYTLHFAGIEALTRAAGEAPPTSRGEVFGFEGNSVPARVFDRALAQTEIAALAAEGVPAPVLPVLTQLRRGPQGQVEALVWQSGTYALGAKAGTRVSVPEAMTLAGPWAVAFQEHRGAPASISLPQLQSLDTNANPGVKYFSGTATYAHTFELSSEALRPGRRVVIDLGRVEVTAAVRMNGREVGTVWKEPYRLDITEAVHPGSNSVEIAVDDLWTNRMIGDEFLPVENQYGLRNEQGNDPDGIVKLPEWYRDGKPKPPGGRVTFSTWHFYNKDEPLVASGLLGPVRILNPVQVVLGGGS